MGIIPHWWSEYPPPTPLHPYLFTDCNTEATAHSQSFVRGRAQKSTARSKTIAVGCSKSQSFSHTCMQPANFPRKWDFINFRHHALGDTNNTNRFRYLKLSNFVIKQFKTNLKIPSFEICFWKPLHFGLKIQAYKNIWMAMQGVEQTHSSWKYIFACEPHTQSLSHRDAKKICPLLPEFVFKYSLFPLLRISQTQGQRSLNC